VTEGGTIQAQPDLIRVFYYLKPDEEELYESEGSYSEQPPLSLFRATTTTLPLEDESIGDILETGTTTTTVTESGEEQPQIDEVAIANYVQSLDFKYSDGEEWYESWDDTERPPKAVQVIVTVTDASGKGKSFTQSTMVYLTLTANFSEQGAGAQSGGQVPQGGGQGGMPAGGGR